MRIAQEMVPEHGEDTATLYLLQREMREKKELLDSDQTTQNLVGRLPERPLERGSW